MPSSSTVSIEQNPPPGRYTSRIGSPRFVQNLFELERNNGQRRENPGVVSGGKRGQETIRIARGGAIRYGLDGA
jgi:hypothetical protein